MNGAEFGAMLVKDSILFPLLSLFSSVKKIVLPANGRAVHLCGHSFSLSFLLARPCCWLGW
jgi:hypothetical protein